MFERAIASIRELNKRGFGMGGDLRLDLVYNVAGPFLPLPQDMIEAALLQFVEKYGGTK